MKCLFSDGQLFASEGFINEWYARGGDDFSIPVRVCTRAELDEIESPHWSREPSPAERLAEIREQDRIEASELVQGCA
jgi:hypothetical protein